MVVRDGEIGSRGEKSSLLKPSILRSRITRNRDEDMTSGMEMEILRQDDERERSKERRQLILSR